VGLAVGTLQLLVQRQLTVVLVVVAQPLQLQEMLRVAPVLLDTMLVVLDRLATTQPHRQPLVLRENREVLVVEVGQ
jgi:hypothetical protein